MQQHAPRRRGCERTSWKSFSSCSSGVASNVSSSPASLSFSASCGQSEGEGAAASAATDTGTVHASCSGGRLTAHTRARQWHETSDTAQPALRNLPFATAAATYGHRCRSHGDSTGPSTLAGTADTPADPREHTHTHATTGASEQCTGNSTSACHPSAARGEHTYSSSVTMRRHREESEPQWSVHAPRQSGWRRAARALSSGRAHHPSAPPRHTHAPEPLLCPTPCLTSTRHA